jgi:hypothetical protein
VSRDADGNVSFHISLTRHGRYPEICDQIKLIIRGWRGAQLGTTLASRLESRGSSTPGSAPMPCSVGVPEPRSPGRDVGPRRELGAPRGTGDRIVAGKRSLTKQEIPSSQEITGVVARGGIDLFCRAESSLVRECERCTPLFVGSSRGRRRAGVRWTVVVSGPRCVHTARVTQPRARSVRNSL